jgi:creatinine amidohydrolase
MLPMGSMEHFGPTAPIGTNGYLAREVSVAAAQQAYVVIFPEYYVAAAASSSAEPGTISYSLDMQMKFLDETTREMARNGCKKIILGNGHTPNMQLINLYMENFRSVPRDYVVYTIYITAFPVNYSNGGPYPQAMLPSKPGADGHGGEERVAAMLVNHPNLIHLDRSGDEPLEPGHGAEDRHNAPPAGGLNFVPTGYFGDPSGATVERGRALMDWATARLVKFIQQVRADNKTLALQKELYERIQQPRMPSK